MWDLITRQCPNRHGGLTQQPLKIGHEGAITSSNLISVCNGVPMSQIKGWFRSFLLIKWAPDDWKAIQANSAKQTFPIWIDMTVSTPQQCAQAVFTQITRFMGPTWGPPGSCRPQMGPMLAPWTLLSGILVLWTIVMVIWWQTTAYVRLCNI